MVLGGGGRRLREAAVLVGGLRGVGAQAAAALVLAGARRVVLHESGAAPGGVQVRRGGTGAGVGTVGVPVNGSGGGLGEWVRAQGGIPAWVWVPPRGLSRLVTVPGVDPAGGMAHVWVGVLVGWGYGQRFWE